MFNKYINNIIHNNFIFNTHFKPDPQSILITYEGTSNGIPALTEACLAGF